MNKDKQRYRIIYIEGFPIVFCLNVEAYKYCLNEGYAIAHFWSKQKVDKIREEIQPLYDFGTN